MRQFFKPKGVDKEWGEERSSGDGAKQKVTAGPTTKSRGGIGAKDAVAPTTNHH